MLAGALYIEMSANVARLAADLAKATGIVTDFGKNVDRIVALSKTALGSLGVGLSVTGFASFVKGGINAEAQLHKLSIQTGITVELLSALKGIAKQSGTDLESVAGLVNKLEKNMAQFAQNGGGKAAAAFKQLDYSQAQVKAGLQDMDTFLPEFAKRLVETGVGGEQAGLAMQLMAKGGAAALPFLRQLAENGPLVAKVLTAQAEAAHQFEVNMAKLQGGAGALSRDLANIFLPQLTATTKAMLDAKAAGEGFFGMMVAGIKTAITGDDLNKAQRDLVDLTNQKLDLENKVSGLRSRITNPENQPEMVRNLSAYLKELQAVEAQLKTTINYKRVLEAENEKPPEKPRTPLLDAPDEETFKARMELQTALLKINLDALKDFYASEAAISDAYHKAGLVSDANYYRAKRETLISALNAEVAVLEKTITAEIKLKAQATTPAEKLKVEIKLLEASAAVDKLRAKAMSEVILLTIAEKEATKALTLEMGKMAIAVAELNRFRDAANATVQDSIDAHRSEAADLEFENTLIGKTVAQIALLTAARRVDLDLRTAIAALPQDGDGNFLVGGAEAFEKLRAAADEFKKTMVDLTADKSFKTYMKDLADDASNRWRKAGSEIQDSLTKAFGSSGAAIGGMVKAFADGRAQQLELDKKFREDLAAAPARQAQLEAKYQNDTVQNSLKSYGDMAGAAAQFFDKQSTAYKVLTAIEQAMYFARFALQAQGLVNDLLGTTTTVANSAVRSSALGVEAVINQGQGDPYTAWARMAAMAAVVAGLGIAIRGGVSGSGGGQSAADIQKTQGTGTVLGDSSAKSDSIEKALKALQSIDTLGLTYTKSMLDALLAIQSSIGNLAAAVFRSAGITAPDGSGLEGTTRNSVLGSTAITKIIDPLGGFSLIPFHDKLNNWIWGTTKQEVTNAGIQILGTLQGIRQNAADSVMQFQTIRSTSSGMFGGLFGGGSSSERDQTNPLNRNAARQIGLLFKDITSAVEDAVKALGLWTPQLHDLLMSLPIDMKLSLKDLKGQEVTDAIKAFFSAIADTIAVAGLPSVGTAGFSFDANEFFEKFQKAGEGAFETLIRVATEFEVVQNTFKLLGFAVSNVGMSSIAAADGIITLMGGIDKFQSAMASFMSHYYTPTEQRDISGSALSSSFQGLGVEMPASLAAFRKMMQDAAADTSEAGQKLFAGLLKLEGGFYDFTTTIIGLDGKLHSAADTLQQHIELQERLDIATGRKTEQQITREREMADAIDNYSLLLLQAVYAQEDTNAGLAAAHDRRRAEMSAEIELMREQGNRAGALAQQRALDIESMTAVEIASYDYIASLRGQTEALREQTSWQDQLDALTGKRTQKEIERAKQWDAALSVGARATMAAVFAEQDLKEARDKAAEAAKVTAGLRDRLAVLTGDRTQQDIERAREWLDAKSAEDRALLVMIFNAEDVAQAAKNAAAALKTMHDQLITFQNTRIGGATQQDAQFNADAALAAVMGLVPSLTTMAQVANMTSEQFLALNEQQREAVNLARQANNAVINFAGTLNQVALDWSTGYGMPIVPGSGTGPSAADLESQRIALQLQIAELQIAAGGPLADAARAFKIQLIGLQRQIAINALDPSLQALQAQLYGLQDAAEAAAKALEFGKAKNALQIQILRALGDEAAAVLLEQANVIAEINAQWGVGTTQAGELIAMYQQLWAVQSTTGQGLDKWKDQIRDWLKGNLLDTNLSPLTAQQQLLEAKRQYDADLSAARGGDTTARDRLTQDADKLLALKKAVEGFGGGYSALFASVRTDLANFIGQPALALPSAGDNLIVSNIVQLRADVNDQKVVVARLLERILDATTTQTATVAGAVTGGAATTASAVTTAAVVNERR